MVQSAPNEAIELTVVIPSYQPGWRLGAMVAALIPMLERVASTYEVLVVDDGSTDGSSSALGAEWPCVRVVRHDVNRGKGAALRTGFAEARGAFIAMIDADGQYDPADLEAMVAMCRSGWDVASGQRFDLAARTDYSPVRRIGSRAMAAAISVVVDDSLSESQAGLKVFRREVIEAVRPYLKCEGFAIDAEILAAAKALGFRRHGVHPVRFEHDGRTTVTFAASVRMLCDLVRIRRRLGQIEAPRSDSSERRGRFERETFELLAHALRLAAVGPESPLSVLELVERSGGDSARVIAAITALGSMRTRHRESGIAELDLARGLLDATRLALVAPVERVSSPLSLGLVP
jgi:hypothetical protein